MIKCKIFSQERVDTKGQCVYDTRQELEDRINKWLEKNTFPDTKIIHVLQSFNECPDQYGNNVTGGISITIFYRDN